MYTARFKSNSFPKYPNEDNEIINPGCWGKRLAEWIQLKLPEKGIQTGEIMAEDWGWVVELDTSDFISFIGCGVSDESDEEFVAFIEVKCPFSSLFPSFIKAFFRQFPISIPILGLPF